MYITTTEKKIKTHLIQVDDTEVERYLKEPDTWIELLSDLLMAEPKTNGDGPQKAKIKKVDVTRRHKTSGPGIEMVDCPKCGMRVKTRGLLVHQRGSKCKKAAHIDPFSTE
jgi:hypothetical protein